VRQRLLKRLHPAVHHGARSRARQAYSFSTWKEFFRDKYLGTRIVAYEVPGETGTLSREERVSTEELGDRKYAKHIDKVMAFGATELGLEWQYKKMEEWETHGQLRRAM
jgi:hypothetical protein